MGLAQSRERALVRSIRTLPYDLRERIAFFVMVRYFSERRQWPAAMLLDDAGACPLALCALRASDVLADGLNSAISSAAHAVLRGGSIVMASYANPRDPVRVSRPRLTPRLLPLCLDTVPEGYTDSVVLALGPLGAAYHASVRGNNSAMDTRATLEDFTRAIRKVTDAIAGDSDLRLRPLYVAARGSHAREMLEALNRALAFSIAAWMLEARGKNGDTRDRAHLYTRSACEAMTETDVIMLENTLKCGMDINVSVVCDAFRGDRRERFRPLTLAARHGRADVIRLLGTVDTFPGNEEALVEAVKLRNAAVVMALVHVGANVTDAVIRAAIETRDDATMSAVLKAKEMQRVEDTSCVVS